MRGCAEGRGHDTEAAKSALQWTNNNAIFGAANSTANVRVTFSGPTGTCGTSCDVTSIPPCATTRGAFVWTSFGMRLTARIAAARRSGRPIPTLFGPLIGITEQRVRATATAQVSSGNQIVHAAVRRHRPLGR